MRSVVPKTIDVQSIPLLTLPSVPFTERRRLPQCAAIYFVLNAHGTVLYVGQSINLALRWAAHHRAVKLSEHQATRIAWLVMDETHLLNAVETACLAYFEPCCNGRMAPGNTPGPVPKGYKATVIQLPPDLLDWAKHQPEGLSGLARRLLTAERARQAQCS
jgi:hypothetical protein